MMTMAGNEGAAGATAGMGAGMGMGMAAGGAFGAVASSVFAPFAQQVASQSTPTGLQQPSSRFTPKAKTATFECPACHAAVQEGCKFCPECGAKIEVKKSFCVNCGKELPSGCKFCPECGSKQ